MKGQLLIAFLAFINLLSAQTFEQLQAYLEKTKLKPKNENT